MNEVITSYYEESHRALQKQRPSHQEPPRAYIGASVSLPPLQQGSSLPSDAGERSGRDGGLGGGPGGGSQAKFEFNKELAIAGIQEERYQEVLRENERLTRKMRQLQDQLTITSAKKEAFKVQATRVEKEKRKAQEQADYLQREMLSFKQDYEYCSVKSKDAEHKMDEMRKSHLQEVRLLQRGLAQRGDEKMRNRVNEVADLVDKLGRAVVQRDEAIKEKTKLQAQLHQIKSESKTLHEERSKLRKQNKDMSDKLKKANRDVKTLMAPIERDEITPDLSDDEFESELTAFEKRYSVLDDGAKGLDHFVEQLTKTKEKLQQQNNDQAETIASLEKSLDHWQNLCQMKDQKIQELSKKLSEMQREQTILEQQVAAKQKEIDMQIQIEREAIGKQFSHLQGEADQARSTAEGMQVVGDKLQKELTKYHEAHARMQYAKDNASLDTVDESATYDQFMDSSMLDGGSLMTPGAQTANPQDKAIAREVVFGTINMVLEQQGCEPLTRVLMQQAKFLKTGELLQLEVMNAAEGLELRGHDLSSGEKHVIALDQELIDALDPEDPWIELFGMVGMSRGPPRRLALPTTVGRRDEVTLPPAGIGLELTIYMYDPRRYYISGVDLQETQETLDLVLIEDAFTAEQEKDIDACQTPDALFDFFVANMSLHNENGRLKLHFGSQSDVE